MPYWMSQTLMPGCRVCCIWRGMRRRLTGVVPGGKIGLFECIRCAFAFQTIENFFGSSELLVEISTTECSEAPSATRKVAMEKTSAKYQPPQTRLSGDLQDTATNINAIGGPQLWRMGNGGSRVEVERV